MAITLDVSLSTDSLTARPARYLTALGSDEVSGMLRVGRLASDVSLSIDSVGHGIGALSHGTLDSIGPFSDSASVGPGLRANAHDHWSVSDVAEVQSLGAQLQDESLSSDSLVVAGTQSKAELRLQLGLSRWGVLWLRLRYRTRNAMSRMIAPADTTAEAVGAIGLFGTGFTVGADAGDWAHHRYVGAVAGLYGAIRVWNRLKRH